MTKAIIVEDEARGMNNLKAMLKDHCPDVKIIGEARSNYEGQQLLARKDIKPDVAFLDINLPDGPVFNLLNQVRGGIDFDIIFVTAYEEYAIQACRYSSIGYITKPLDSYDLKDAVGRIKTGSSNKIEERLDLFRQQYNHPNAFEKISIFADDGIYFIKMSDIVRCEAESNYTHIYLHGGKHILSSKTLGYYETMLKRFNFYRVHKQHIVNLNFMTKFVKGDGGYLLMDDGSKVEVSRRRRRDFIAHISQSPSPSGYLIILTANGTYRVAIKDIVRFEDEDTCTFIYLQTKECIRSTEMIHVYNGLLKRQNNFHWVHKRHLINADFMVDVLKGKECYIVMKDGKMIEISPDKLDRFL